MTGGELLLPLLIGAGSAGASTLLSRRSSEPVKLPPPQAPVRMPDPFQERANAREEERQKLRLRKGRSSTDLSDDGSGTYLSNNLGE